MSDLLANPAVQAGVAPFLVALAVAALLRRGRLLGLAIGAAFLVVIALTMGFSVEVLTSLRKLMLVGVGTIVLVPVLELPAVRSRKGLAIAVAVASAATAVWIPFRVIAQIEGWQAYGAGLAAAAFMAVLVDGTRRACADDPVRSASAALVLGLGAGGLALQGASAQLAQIGIAIGAGAGAALFVQMLAGAPATRGWSLALPANVVSGLAGLLAVFTGSLAWPGLLALLVAPWAMRLVPQRDRPVWLTAIMSAVAALVPVLLTLVWFRISGSSPT